jgi:cobalt-zinc-cadmium efflux system membrane fusion protein
LVNELPDSHPPRLALPRRLKAVIVLGLLVIAAGGITFMTLQPRKAPDIDLSSQARRSHGFYRPTEAEWATFAIETVQRQLFRTQYVTEGKIAVDEDRSTPVFSPYAGRVTKLLVRPGDEVTAGQLLFTVEATDMVQGLSDFIAAIAAMNKARSQVDLTQIVERRNRELYEGKAVPLKEWQKAQADLTAAENDLRSAETALEAARNRLRILGRTSEEIAAFQDKGRISAETPIYAPIGGTIVQRKLGPGQYVSTGASDPVFVIGDLSTVWLTAFVRETEAAGVHVGQEIDFTVLSFPDRMLTARLNYVAALLDPASRRLMVRATIENSDKRLKPEMFAKVAILSDEGTMSAAVPRAALIHEGSVVRVWIAHDDKTIELRQIETGLTDGSKVQIVEGVIPGERVITRGSVFIDRAS